MPYENMTLSELLHALDEFECVVPKDLATALVQAFEAELGALEENNNVG